MRFLIGETLFIMVGITIQWRRSVRVDVDGAAWGNNSFNSHFMCIKFHEFLLELLNPYARDRGLSINAIVTFAGILAQCSMLYALHLFIRILQTQFLGINAKSGSTLPGSICPRSMTMKYTHVFLHMVSEHESSCSTYLFTQLYSYVFTPFSIAVKHYCIFRFKYLKYINKLFSVRLNGADIWIWRKVENEHRKWLQSLFHVVALLKPNQ